MLFQGFPVQEEGGITIFSILLETFVFLIEEA